MIHPGLCSITFRKLSAQEIIRLVAKAGLKGVEWGGDVHAPHGNVSVANEVRKMTLDAGLIIPSYGSYYRVGISEKEIPFAKVIESAMALGAPMIRVWAGDRNYNDADPDFIQIVVQDALRIADLAAKAGVQIGFEYHNKTFTNTPANTAAFTEKVKHPDVLFYWQTSQDLLFSENLASLNAILPRLTHLHVFHWMTNAEALKHSGQSKRLALEKGREDWKAYMDTARKVKGDRWALLEFVREDRVEAFLEDAEILKQLCKAENGAI